MGETTVSVASAEKKHSDWDDGIVGTYYVKYAFAGAGDSVAYTSNLVGCDIPIGMEAIFIVGNRAIGPTVDL